MGSPLYGPPAPMPIAAAVEYSGLAIPRPAAYEFGGRAVTAPFRPAVWIAELHCEV